MSYSLTIFRSIFDNKTHRRVNLDTWDEFEKLMNDLSKQEGYKPKKEEKFHPKASPLISPAVFPRETTRKNANVIGWAGWAAMDIDSYEGSFEDALSVFNEQKCIVYSSASSTKEHPKFRVVFPLDRDVKKDEIKHFWYALNKEFNSLGDPQTKDLSRMYYVPAQYPNAFNFILFNRNKPVLDVDALKAKHEFTEVTAGNSFFNNLPEEVQRQIIEHRKTKLSNTSYSWRGLSDCPFVNKELIAEYRAITNTGWYRQMYRIMMSIASSAIKRGYPITAKEISLLCKELDNSTGNWYENRDMESEAERAITFACQSL